MIRSTLFPTGDGAPRSAPGAIAYLQHAQGQSLEFLVHRDPFIAGFWESLKAWFQPARLSSGNQTLRIFRTAIPRPPRFRGLQFTGSILFHFSLIALLVYLPRILPPTSMPL